MRFRYLAYLATCMVIAGSSHSAEAMTLASTDILEGGMIPSTFIYEKCGGQNVSPDLSWVDPPAETRSLVLTMIDLDVKPSLWSHWIVTGLPAMVTTLPRGVSPLPPGAHAVANNFGDAAYDGPCPPAGSGLHRYRFTVWAMPTPDIAITGDIPATEVLAKLAKESIAHASLTASVER